MGGGESVWGMWVGVRVCGVCGCVGYVGEGEGVWVGVKACGVCGSKHGNGAWIW